MAKLTGRLGAASISILLWVPLSICSPALLLEDLASRTPELVNIPSSATIDIEPPKPGSVAHYHAVEKSIYALESREKSMLAEEPQNIGHGLPVSPALSKIDREVLDQPVGHSPPVSPVGDSPGSSRSYLEALSRGDIGPKEITWLEAVAGLSIYKRGKALKALRNGDIFESEELLKRAINCQSDIESFHLLYPSKTSALYQTKPCETWLQEWKNVKKDYKGFPTKGELSEELQELANERIQLEGIRRVPVPVVRFPGEPGESQYTAVESAIQALKCENSAATLLQSDDLVAALQSLRSGQKALEEAKKARDTWVTETGDHFSLMDYEIYRTSKQRYETKRLGWVSTVLAWLGFLGNS